MALRSGSGEDADTPGFDSWAAFSTSSASLYDVSVFESVIGRRWLNAPCCPSAQSTRTTSAVSPDVVVIARSPQSCRINVWKVRRIPICWLESTDCALNRTECSHSTQAERICSTVGWGISVREVAMTAPGESPSPRQHDGVCCQPPSKHCVGDAMRMNSKPAGETASLQVLLAAMLDLELSVKHAQWNCYGAGFRDLRLHLDGLADMARSRADALAERALATGESPDVRAATVATGSDLPSLPLGPILVDVATAEVATIIEHAVALCHQHLRLTADPVTCALVVSMVASLEHHRWLLVAEFSSEPPARPAGSCAEVEGTGRGAQSLPAPLRGATTLS
jgi:starvation-inducible DNA-binding protein